MTGPERGFLLLCSHLGDPERKVLTTAQFRKLSQLVSSAQPVEKDRELTAKDLKALGLREEMALRIVKLLEEEERLDRYLSRAAREDCHVITLFSPHYPRILEDRLGLDAPALLWCKGDPALLAGDCIGLVGSRELEPANASFAHQAGIQAAMQSITLVSGNARGADRAAQEGCLNAGGRVISVVADGLNRHSRRENLLYLSEDSFDLEFSAQRALSRNRLIHSLGFATLVAQSSLKHGGTWDGSVKNLRFGWSPLFCYEDGSESIRMLCQMGAESVDAEALKNLRNLRPTPSLF
ncbi:MAG: DNA-protecting protein DprA [Oscillospiraceae bacterium]|nr:DNA-protecting protein DprA [Oscillospiraceae bacterium]